MGASLSLVCPVRQPQREREENEEEQDAPPPADLRWVESRATCSAAAGEPAVTAQTVDAADGAAREVSTSSPAGDEAADAHALAPATLDALVAATGCNSSIGAADAASPTPAAPSAADSASVADAIANADLDADDASHELPSAQPPVALGKLCAECGGLLYGRWKRCGGCKVVFYCNAEHAAANWVAHRDMCRAEQARIEAIACESGLVLGADAEAARRAAFLAAEAENAAAAAMTAERARIEALDEESLRAELSFRGIIPPRGTPLAQLLAQRLAAPDPTPASLQASRERARYRLAMSACRLCGSAFAESESCNTTGRCLGCKRVRYCGAECQRGDWQRHKPECRAWRAEADAAIVAAGGCPLGDVKAQEVAIARFLFASSAAVRDAAEGGNLAAQLVLGDHFDSGLMGPMDRKQARKWYELAAAGNVANAQQQLACYHERGWGGLAVNLAEAARHYGLAASQGHAVAQGNLGIFLYEGLGVKRNLAESVRLFRMSAEQGHASAQANLSRAYLGGEGVAVDYTAAMLWGRRAAESGGLPGSHGANNVGVMYHNGFGVPRDHRTAALWYERAANEGNKAAEDNLRRLELGGLPEATAALRRLRVGGARM